jgi:hypothetical protein
VAPGELVELFDAQTTAEYIVVGSMDNTVDWRRRFPFGTLVLFIDEYPNQGEPASVILVGGQPGWVWNHEIRPVNGATQPA